MSRKIIRMDLLERLSRNTSTSMTFRAMSKTTEPPNKYEGFTFLIKRPTTKQNRTANNT